MTTTYREETANDKAANRGQSHAAFGGDAEAKLVDALRDGGFVQLSLVADVEGSIVGHVLFSRIEITGEKGTVPALALAPVAVLPTWQNQGIGSTLIRSGLDRCRQVGCRIVIVVGHPSYYPRFGFSAELAASLQSEYSGNAFMALELAPGALEGVAGEVVYSPPFKMV